MLVHESVDSPEAVAAGLLQELTASDAELGALFTARSAQAFAEQTALALYQQLAPYGAVAGKQPDSRFVAENFNALYGLFLLQRGDERAALPLAERQRRLAPEHVTTLDLLMRALHLNGKRVAAEATRQRALDLYPDCDRFKLAGQRFNVTRHSYPGCLAPASGNSVSTTSPSTNARHASARMGSSPVRYILRALQLCYESGTTPIVK